LSVDLREQIVSDWAYRLSSISFLVPLNPSQPAAGPIASSPAVPIIPAAVTNILQTPPRPAASTSRLGDSFSPYKQSAHVTSLLQRTMSSSEIEEQRRGVLLPLSRSLHDMAVLDSRLYDEALRSLHATHERLQVFIFSGLF
jgi:hypothetical protein